MLRWRLLTFFLLKFILSVRLKEKSNYIELFISLKKALVRKGKKREHNRKIQRRTKQKQTTKQTKDRKSNKNCFIDEIVFKAIIHI